MSDTCLTLWKESLLVAARRNFYEEREKCEALSQDSFQYSI